MKFLVLPHKTENERKEQKPYPTSKSSALKLLKNCH